MANTRYDPWRELEDSMRGMVFQPVPVTGEQGEISIKLDASEDAEAYRITAEMPGVRKEDIRVAVEGDSVSITAEVRQEKARSKASAWFGASATSGRCHAASDCLSPSMSRRQKRSMRTGCSR